MFGQPLSVPIASGFVEKSLTTCWLIALIVVQRTFLEA